MSASQRIPQLARNVEQLLNVRELNDEFKKTIDEDYDLWLATLDFTDVRGGGAVEEAFEQEYTPPKGSKMTKEEINLYVIRMLLDTNDYYIRNKRAIVLRYLRKEIRQDPSRLRYLLADGFVANKAEYSFNAFGLATYRETFENKADALFIERGYVNAVDSEGYTALIKSAVVGNIGRMKFLLMNRADPTIIERRNNEEISAFGSLLIETASTAAYKVHELLEMIDNLIEKGATMEATSRAFVILVRDLKNLAVVTKLVNYGIDVNKKAVLRGINGDFRNEISVTPLFAACYGGDIEMMTFLYNHGARLNDPHDILLTIFQGEEDNNLLGYTQNWKTNLSSRVNEDIRYNALKTVVNYGGNIYALDDNGNNLVGVIALKAFPYEAKVVIESFLKLVPNSTTFINHVNKDGQSILEQIVIRFFQFLQKQEGLGDDQFNLIEYFLQLGANPDVIYTKYGHNDLYTEIKDFINSCPLAKDEDDNEDNEELYQGPCDNGEREEARLLLNLFDFYFGHSPTPPTQTPPPAAAAAFGRNQTTTSGNPDDNVENADDNVENADDDSGDVDRVTSDNIDFVPLTLSERYGKRHEDILRNYMRANNIQASARGNITADVLRIIADKEDIRGWTTKGDIDQKRAFIATELAMKGL